MLSVQFSDAITLGSIIATLVVLAVAGLFTLRSRVATVWRSEAESWRERAERLATEAGGSKDRIHELEVEVARLQAATDFTSVREEQREFHQELVRALGDISTKDAERYKEAVTGITSRLDKNYEAIMTVHEEFTTALTTLNSTLLRVLERIFTSPNPAIAVVTPPTEGQ